MIVGAVLFLAVVSGCGTTRWTDTARTANEQLLISRAVDEAVLQLDFSGLAGQAVYLDTQFLDGAVDKGYLISSLRQGLLSGGCRLQQKPEAAEYVVEVRSGALATNRSDTLVGIPQTTLPTILTGAPVVVPEISLLKTTTQTGVAKVAVFAYHRETGWPAWQPALAHSSSQLRNRWILGMGPSEQGGSVEPAWTFCEGFPLPWNAAGPQPLPGQGVDCWPPTGSLPAYPARRPRLARLPAAGGTPLPRGPASNPGYN